MASGRWPLSTAVHNTKSPRQLYNIAKSLGIWDPAKIDLTEDKAHWQMLNPEQREQLIKTCALFYEGDVSVSDTLAWFMLAMPDLDRRMFLSTQIFEEVKHAEFFERYFQEVCGKVDTSAYLVPEYKGVLLDDLREQLEQNPDHVEPVRALFMREAANIPRRTEFIFSPNPLGLDRDKIQQISYANHAQRMREAGLN